MFFKTTKILLSLLVVATGQTIDWCNMQSCGTNKHIACNNNGAFASSCVAPVAGKLTAEEIKLILDGHNSKRNSIASGSLSRFLPAKRMAKLSWDDQMSNLADLNTKQCKMAHDACRNTPKFKHSGQNLAIFHTTGTYSVKTVINNSITMWFNEFTNANMDDINKYSSTSSSGKVIGHFTAMVNDKSTAVGCGYSTFKTIINSIQFNSYLFACNYATTNIIGCPVYKSGDKGSLCVGGTDNIFNGLCKSTESIDANLLC